MFWEIFIPTLCAAGIMYKIIREAYREGKANLYAYARETWVNLVKPPESFQEELELRGRFHGSSYQERGLWSLYRESDAVYDEIFKKNPASYLVRNTERLELWDLPGLYFEKGYVPDEEDLERYIKSELRSEIYTPGHSKYRRGTCAKDIWYANRGFLSEAKARQGFLLDDAAEETARKWIKADPLNMSYGIRLYTQFDVIVMQKIGEELKKHNFPGRLIIIPDGPKLPGSRAFFRADMDVLQPLIKKPESKFRKEFRNFFHPWRDLK